MLFSYRTTLAESTRAQRISNPTLFDSVSTETTIEIFDQLGIWLVIFSFITFISLLFKHVPYTKNKVLVKKPKIRSQNFLARAFAYKSNNRQRSNRTWSIPNSIHNKIHNPFIQEPVPDVLSNLHNIRNIWINSASPMVFVPSLRHGASISFSQEYPLSSMAS